jgi:hypothetical protein
VPDKDRGPTSGWADPVEQCWPSPQLAKRRFDACHSGIGEQFMLKTSGATLVTEPGREMRLLLRVGAAEAKGSPSPDLDDAISTPRADHEIRVERARVALPAKG